MSKSLVYLYIGGQLLGQPRHCGRRVRRSRLPRGTCLGFGLGRWSASSLLWLVSYGWSAGCCAEWSTLAWLGRLFDLSASWAASWPVGSAEGGTRRRPARAGNPWPYLSVLSYAQAGPSLCLRAGGDLSIAPPASLPAGRCRAPRPIRNPLRVRSTSNAPGPAGLPTEPPFRLTFMIQLAG